MQEDYILLNTIVDDCNMPSYSNVHHEPVGSNNSAGAAALPRARGDSDAYSPVRIQPRKTENFNNAMFIDDQNVYMNIAS